MTIFRMRRPVLRAAVTFALVAAGLALPATNAGAVAAAPAAAAAAAAPAAAAAAAAPAAVAVPAQLVGLDGPTGRIALFSSSTGKVVRYLTPASTKWEEGLPVLSSNKALVFFIRSTLGLSTPPVWGTFKVSTSGGSATLFRTAPYGGAQPIAVGPKGAYAGNYGSIATRGIEAANGARRRVVVYGTRDTPDDALAWSPDGMRLAIGTIATATAPAAVHVLDTRGGSTVKGLGPVVACPTALKGCGLHGAGYAPNGSLYMVATKGSLVYLVRLAAGAKLPQLVVRLPKAALSYRVFVAPTGAVLAQAETWTGSATRSAFVAIWNGARLRQLPTTILEPAW